jgi:hypothetical protein
MPDLTPYMSTIIIGALVVAGLLLLLLLYKLFAPSVRGRRGSRLGISEYHEIDKTRRLVLVRRDDVEHLLLIGGGEDIVVENGIGSPMTEVQQSSPRQPPMMQQGTMASPQSGFRSPRPPVFASRRPDLRSVANDEDGN